MDQALRRQLADIVCDAIINPYPSLPKRVEIAVNKIVALFESPQVDAPSKSD